MAAVFSWPCPTVGSQSLISENEPVHFAICEQPADGPLCGREMHWDGRWLAITPLQSVQ